MTSTRQFPATRQFPSSWRALTVLVVAALLVVLLPMLPGAAAAPDVPAASVAGRLQMSVTGRFADAAVREDKLGMVAGVASPAWLAQGAQGASAAIPFRFTAACDALTPCPDGAQVRWDFGDGTSQSGEDLLSLTHTYTNPGVYTATVNVTGAGSSGTATIKALVSPRFADADAALPGKPARPDAEAIWAVAALGLLEPCRTYLGGTSAAPAYDYQQGQGATDPGRAAFCAEPTPPPAAGSLTTPTAPENPITGVSCLTSWQACGLPAHVLAETSSPRGNPLAACGEACQKVLRETGVLTADGRLVFDPANCLDNLAAARKDNAWVLTTGAGAGCTSRGDFFTALATALDGTHPNASGAAGPALCTDGPGTGPAAAGMRRAAALLGSPIVLRGRGGQSFCDTDATITKAEAYRAVAKAAGMADADVSTLRDLDDMTLGTAARTPYPGAGALGALLAQGGPLVGSSSCVDGDGVCFNPEEGLTRAMSAHLLAAMIVGPTSVSSGLHVSLRTPTPAPAVGRRTQVSARITVPAHVAAGSKVSITWPGAGPDGVRSCTATAQVSVSPRQPTTVSCYYTFAAAGPVSLPVTVSDGRATSTTALTLNVSNTAPVLGTETFGALTEDVPAQVTISGRDAEGGALSYTVRSCATGDPAPCTPQDYTQTGASATTAWAGTANTAVGPVTVTAAASGALVRLTPAANANGPFAAMLRVCDSLECTSRAVSGELTAVNDAPVTAALVSARTSGGATTLTLSGADTADAGRPGCAPSIDAYRIVTLPSAGTLQVDSGAGFVPATAGMQTSNATVRWTPGTAGGTFGFTYAVRDTGCPGPGSWSTPGQAVLAYEAPAGPQVNAALTPARPTAAVTDVQVDASATTSGAALTGFTFTWGDGTTTGPQTSPVAQHRYASAGTFEVTVAATDVRGTTGRTTVSVTVEPNLAPNPTGDGSASGWTATNGTLSSSTAPRSGPDALRLTPSKRTARIDSTVTGPAGTYTFTAWVRSASPSSNGYPFTLTLGSGAASSSASVTMTNTWQKVSVTHVAGVDGQLRLTAGGVNIPGGAVIDVDDISLTR